MPVTVADLRATLPEFTDVAVEDTIVVNSTAYTVTGKEMQSPAPGEVTFTLHLTSDDHACVLSWNEAHTVETAWIHDHDANPMTNGTKIETIEYHG